MANKKPLVISNGNKEQLQDADNLEVTNIITDGLIDGRDISNDGIVLDSLKQSNVDVNEPTGFIREFPLTMGIMEFSPDGTIIHRISYDSTFSTSDSTHVNYDPSIIPGQFYDGTAANAREFAIHPVKTSDGGDDTYTVYIESTKFVISNTQKVTIPDTTGLKFIYHNSNGTLAIDSAFSFEYFEDNPITSVIYRNSSSSSILVFGDERHGIQMDGFTHRYLHFNEGFRHQSGMLIQGLVEGGTTYTQITSGLGYDEDIYLTIPQQTVAPFMYLNGNAWDLIDDGNDIAYLNVGVAQFNENIGTVEAPNFVLSDITGNDIGIMFIAATNNRIFPYVKMVGQEAYQDIKTARAAIETAWKKVLVGGGLPFPEFLPIGAILVNASGEVQVLTDDSLYFDMRELSIVGSGVASGVATYHADLLSRDAIDSHPSTAISYDNSTSGLVATEVKSALDELADAINVSSYTTVRDT